MPNKFEMSNRRSLACKIYVILLITLPLGIAAVLLAFLAGDFFSGGIFSVMALIWIASRLGEARMLSNSGIGNTSRDEKGSGRRRRQVRTIYLALLIFSIAALPGIIIFKFHLYFLLSDLYIIIVSVTELLLTRSSIYGVDI